MAEITGKRKVQARARRHRRIRAHISGTELRPRLNVFRSNTHIYAQVIDDLAGKTLASASSIDTDVAPQVKGKSKVDTARVVGKIVAERAKQAGIASVVFDRGGYQYQGRIAALAEGAREAGLEF
jgi:large subunit ribosomal protein L18